jgi:[NiFe] hydrogenase assembly HybE family chaperone
VNASLQTTDRALAQRVAALVAHFEQVRTERMQGIPLLNPLLMVEAVGFCWASTPTDANAAVEPVAEGVLVTPWFMSLVRLQARWQPHGNQVGRKFVRDFGSERFDFIGAHDPAVGYHETCALFSPMQGFDSQARAVETAREALALTRPQPVAPAPVAAREPMPSRRAFFMPGRSAAGGAAR